MSRSNASLAGRQMGAVIEVYKNGVLTPVPVREFLDNSEKDKNYLQQFRAVN